MRLIFQLLELLNNTHIPVLFTLVLKVDELSGWLRNLQLFQTDVTLLQLCKLLICFACVASFLLPLNVRDFF